MTKSRAIVAGLAAATLLGIPAAVSSGSALAASGTARHATSIRLMAFLHVHSYAQTMDIRGQVAAHWHKKHGALADAPVRLYRRVVGGDHWSYEATVRTGTGTTPEFVFPVKIQQNADYKIAYGGDTHFAPTSRVTWVEVYRSFHASIKDGPGHATLHGAVTPFYTHKTLLLQRQTCPKCQFSTVKTVTSGLDGAYSFVLGAPKSGSWLWRVALPGTTAYLPSYSATFSTKLK